MNAPEYTFVIPVFNEEESLRELHTRLRTVITQLDGDAEVLLVDDGSTDASFEIMRELHEADPRFRVLRLSRNFGHQIALTAGLDHAQGNAVVIMDADLQDPPEVVLEMAKQWRAGYQVVYGVRDERAGEGLLKRSTAAAFYRVLGRMTDVPVPVDTGDFRLVDRRALDAVRGMREHRRYLRGMFAWVGFSQVGVHYDRPERFAGQTKFSLRRMVRFACDGIVSFSAAPLHAALTLGFLVSTIAFVAGFAAILSKAVGAFTVSGWASLAIAVAFLGGVQLVVLGVVGEYIARIYEEVKERPLYLVRDSIRRPESSVGGTTVGVPDYSLADPTVPGLVGQ
jgi:polyisoprenyl-phosphate glycosyltransferase